MTVFPASLLEAIGATPGARGSPVRIDPAERAKWRLAVMSESGLSMGARVAGFFIADAIHMAPGSNLTGCCWRSQQSLAALMGVHERQVRTYIGELVDAGFITKRRRKAQTALLRLQWPMVSQDRQDTAALDGATSQDRQFSVSRPAVFCTQDRQDTAAYPLEEPSEEPSESLSVESSDRAFASAMSEATANALEDPADAQLAARPEDGFSREEASAPEPEPPPPAPAARSLAQIAKALVEATPKRRRKATSASEIATELRALVLAGGPIASNAERVAADAIAAIKARTAAPTHELVRQAVERLREGMAA